MSPLRLLTPTPPAFEQSLPLPEPTMLSTLLPVVVASEWSAADHVPVWPEVKT